MKMDPKSGESKLESNGFGPCANFQKPNLFVIT